MLSVPLLFPVINKMAGLACKQIVQLTNVFVAQNYSLPVVVLLGFSIQNSYFGGLFLSSEPGGKHKPGVTTKCECERPKRGGRCIGWGRELSTAQTGRWCCWGRREDLAEPSGAECPGLGLLEG